MNIGKRFFNSSAENFVTKFFASLVVPDALMQEWHASKRKEKVGTVTDAEDRSILATGLSRCQVQRGGE
jgi:hypothetical protein